MARFLYKLILTLSLIYPVIAADDSLTYSPSKRHLSIRDALSEFNARRLERSNAFDKGAGDKKIAEELPEDLLEIVCKGTKKGEFSRREVVIPLFQKIEPFLGVTGVETLTGGFVSGKIYRVTTVDQITADPRVFYLKYLRTKAILVSKGRCYGEEVNLSQLAQAIYLDDIKSHIDVMLPIASYEYKTNDKRKVFMIIPGAPGKSFSKIVEGQNIEEINRSFSELGSVLGKVHVKSGRFLGSTRSLFPRTCQDFINVRVPSHGDLHGDNVFYDEATNRLSLIDVETMANSFDQEGHAISPICYDMLYILLMSSKKFGKFMPNHNWEPFKALFASYVEAYPDYQKKGIYDYLIYCLTHIERIKFLDIFKYFSFKKGFEKSEIKGAKSIADFLSEAKGKHLIQLRSGRDFVAQSSSIPLIEVPTPQPDRVQIPVEIDMDLLATIAQITPLNNSYLSSMNIPVGRVSKLREKFEAFSQQEGTVLPKGRKR